MPSQLFEDGIFDLHDVFFLLHIYIPIISRTWNKLRSESHCHQRWFNHSVHLFKLRPPDLFSRLPASPVVEISRKIWKYLHSTIFSTDFPDPKRAFCECRTFLLNVASTALYLVVDMLSKQMEISRNMVSKFGAHQWRSFSGEWFPFLTWVSSDGM